MGYSPWGRKELDMIERLTRTRWISKEFTQWLSSKESACNAGDLGWEDPLEKEMATHSSILTWRIPWTEEQAIVHGATKSQTRLK